MYTFLHIIKIAIEIWIGVGFITSIIICYVFREEFKHFKWWDFPFCIMVGTLVVPIGIIKSIWQEITIYHFK